VEDNSLMLAVAPKGGEHRVLVFGTKPPWLRHIAGC